MDRLAPLVMTDVRITAARCEGSTFRPSASYRLAIDTAKSSAVVGLEKAKSEYEKPTSGHVDWRSPFGGRFTMSSSSEGCKLGISVRRSRLGRTGEIVGHCLLDCSSESEFSGEPCLLVFLDGCRSDVANPADLCLPLELQNGPVDGRLILTVSLSRNDPAFHIAAARDEVEKLVSGQGVSEDHVTLKHPSETDVAPISRSTVDNGTAVTRRDAWKLLLDRLSVLMGLMDAVSEVHPWIKLAWGVVSVGYRVTAEQVALDEKIADLVNAMAECCSFANEAEPLRKYSNYEEIISKIMQQVIECVYFVKAYCRDESFGIRAVKNIGSHVDRDIQAYVDNLKALRSRFETGLQIGGTVMIHRVYDGLTDVARAINELEAREILNDLAYAKEARRDFHKACLPGTRVEVVDAIVHWAAEADLPQHEYQKWAKVSATPESRVLWLCGLSGAGKSTVARSVAARLRDMDRLGSFYAFDDANQRVLNPSTLFSTIARDLADHDPVRKRRLVDAIKKSTAIRQSPNCVEQLSEFILVPSRNLASVGSTVIVIDAFDESAAPFNRSELLSLLTTRAQELPEGLRIIVTSRLESDVQVAISQSPPSRGIDVLLLEDVPRTLTSRDIDLFVQQTLHNVKQITPSQLQNLAARAEYSFQWASTACLFIKATGDGHGAGPRSRLQSVLEANQGLDNLYLLVMNREFGYSSTVTLARLSTILGIMVHLQEPLPLKVLLQLASENNKMPEEELDEYQQIMCLLASLIEGAFDLNIPVTPLHTSFADFLRDSSRSGKYSADPEYIQHLISLRCLRAMRSELRFNICNLSTSFKRNRDVQDLSNRVKAHISPLLSYSCRFWPYHISQLLVVDDEVCCAMRTHLGSYFLYWLEVLSLIGAARHGALSPLQSAQRPPAVDTKLSLLSPVKLPLDTRSLLEEVLSFTAIFAVPISESAPHIYLSSAAFTPPSFTIHKALPPSSRSVTAKQGTPRGWPRHGRALTGHSKAVTSVTFSPDGLTVASGSEDATIRIWDVSTGLMLGNPLEGHTDCVTSISYSPESLKLVSGSNDRSIRIWDLNMRTSTCVSRVIEEGTGDGHISCVVFNHCGSMIAFCGWDETIRVTNIHTGRTSVLSDSVRNKRSEVKCVAFSSDDSEIISLVPGGARAITIWNVQACALMVSMSLGPACHNEPIPAMTTNGAHIAVTSWFGLDHIWDARTGEALEQPMEGHAAKSTAIAFSLDTSLIACGFIDESGCMIRVWDVETGAALIRRFWGHTDLVEAIAFSPDGHLMASGAKDCTVRLWDTRPDDSISEPLWTGHERSVLSLAFSPDGVKLASGEASAGKFGSGVIRIWEMATGATLGKPMKLTPSPRIWSPIPDGATGLVFSADGARLAAWDHLGSVGIWSADSGERLGVVPASKGAVIRPAFSPDGTHLLLCDADGTMTIWDCQTGLSRPALTEPFQFSVINGYSNNASLEGCFSSDCKTLIAGVRHWGRSVFDVESGEVKGRIKEDDFTISPDGTLVAGYTSDLGGDVVIMDLTSSTLTETVHLEHSGFTQCVAFSSGGRRIACATHYGHIRVWDGKTGALVGPPLTPGQVEEIRCLAFSPDGTRLASGSDDCKIRIWDMEPYNESHLQVSVTDRSWDRQWKESQYPTSIFPHHPAGLMLQNGWIAGLKGELILWVPKEYRAGLHGPRCRILGEAPFELDFGNFKCGDEWDQCYGTPPSD